MYGVTAEDIATHYGIDNNKASAIVQCATRIADQAINDGYEYSNAIARYNTYIEKKARLAASTMPCDCVGVQNEPNDISFWEHIQMGALALIIVFAGIVFARKYLLHFFGIS